MSRCLCISMSLAFVAVTAGSANAHVERWFPGQRNVVLQHETPAYREIRVGGYPMTLALGPDGALWVGASDTLDDFTTGFVSHVDPVTYQVTKFSLTVDHQHHVEPSNFVLGPDQDLWFVTGWSEGGGHIAKTAGRGKTVGYSAIAVGGPTVGPDGAMWTLPLEEGAFGHTTTDGNYSLIYAPVPPGYGRVNIFAPPAAGPDGNLWYPVAPPGEESAGAINAMTPGGTLVANYQMDGFAYGGLVAGSDGNMYLLVERSEGQAITEVTPSGQFTYGGSGHIFALTPDPVDKSLWYSVFDRNQRYIVEWILGTQKGTEYYIGRRGNGGCCAYDLVVDHAHHSVWFDLDTTRKVYQIAIP